MRKDVWCGLKRESAEDIRVVDGGTVDSVITLVENRGRSTGLTTPRNESNQSLWARGSAGGARQAAGEERPREEEPSMSGRYKVVESRRAEAEEMGTREEGLEAGGEIDETEA